MSASHRQSLNAAGRYDVLVLHSYHKNFEWTDSIMEGFESYIRNSGLEADYSIEYMDTKRFYDGPAGSFLKSLRKLYSLKYSRHKFDLILVTDDNAFNFLLRNHKSLFKDAPAVFCGVSDFSQDMLKKDRNITGIVQKIDRKDTIDLALGLFPGTKNIAFVTDKTTTGQLNRKVFKQLEMEYAGRVNFIFLDRYNKGISLNKLFENIGRLPDKTVLYFSDFYRGVNGFVSPEFIFGKIKELPIPCFSHAGYTLGKGIVGGKLYHGTIQGKEAAKMAVEILKGRDAADIKVEEESLNRYMIDYRQFKKFQADESLIPQDAIVINRPLSSYEKYYYLISTIIAVVVVLVMIIVKLLHTIFQRKEIELELSETNASLKRLYDSATGISIISTDTKGVIKVFNSGAELMLGYKADELIGKFTPEVFHDPDEVIKKSKSLSDEYGKEINGFDAMVYKASLNDYEGSEWTYIKKDGERIKVFLRITSIKKTGGEITGFLGIGTDITKIKEAERAMERRILTLTKPLTDMSDISVHDIFDIDDLQEIQDEFSRATGVASIITFPDGRPITNPSNFCRLCNDIIRKTEKGLINCQMSDSAIGKFNPHGPIIKRCLSGGLWDAGAGITVGGTHVANWLIGQVRDENMEERHIREYAREIGAEEEDSVNAFREIPVMSNERFRAISDFLFKIANQLSDMAYQNLQQARTISEKREKEKELSRLRNYLSNIIDSMPSMIIGIDSTGIVTQWNQSTEIRTGVKAGEAIGNTIDAYLGSLLPNIAFIKEKLGRREIFRELNHSSDSEDGVKYENITIYPLVANGIDGGVIRIDDVTREKDLEFKLSHKNKMDAIGQLAAGVAHDFNNMLAGIMGAAQVLQYGNDNLTDKEKQLIDIIINSSTRASELTAKLLAFGRKGRLDSTPVSIHAVVEDTIKILERSIDKRVGIVPFLDAKRESVVGDNSALQNALMNLSINAAQAMPDGGVLTISTGNVFLDENYCRTSPFDIGSGEYVNISVRDTGIGIPENIIGKIFDPFFTTKAEGRGTGLGLAAVYGIVEDHHGFISVYSEVGAGTVFNIYLPCAEGEAEPVRESSEIVEGTGTVLLVDDEDIIRVTSRYMLERMGYSVISADNGKNAVDIFRKSHDHIDAVIMDMIMPEMNGKDAFIEMKKIDRNCKVIISSGFSKEHNIGDLRRMGLSGFIQKPFNDHELSELLSSVIKG